MFQFCLKRITRILVCFTLTTHFSTFPATPPPLPQQATSANIVEPQQMAIAHTAAGFLRTIVNRLPPHLQNVARTLQQQTAVMVAQQAIERFIVYNDSAKNPKKHTNHTKYLGLLMAIASIAGQLNERKEQPSRKDKTADHCQGKPQCSS